MLNTTDKIIKHKTGLLNLAEKLGNVSKACQVMALDSHFKCTSQVLKECLFRCSEPEAFSRS